jgi:hypothetical protein
VAVGHRHAGGFGIEYNGSGGHQGFSSRQRTRS